MEFNKTTCREVSNITKETLNDALKHLGVTVQQCSGKYSPLEFTMKVVLATTTEDGETQIMKDYRTYATMYDLPKDHRYRVVLMRRNLDEVLAWAETASDHGYRMVLATEAARVSEVQGPTFVVSDGKLGLDVR